MLRFFIILSCLSYIFWHFILLLSMQHKKIYVVLYTDRIYINKSFYTRQSISKDRGERSAIGNWSPSNFRNTYIDNHTMWSKVNLQIFGMSYLLINNWRNYTLINITFINYKYWECYSNYYVTCPNKLISTTLDKYQIL